ncbi:hypothetical protein [Streptomyces sp. NPDC059994]
MRQIVRYAQGYTPLQAGLRLLPAPLGLIVTSMTTPALMQASPSGT